MRKTPKQDAIFGAMPGTNITIQAATGYARPTVSHFILRHRDQVFIKAWVPVGDRSVQLAPLYARGTEMDAPRPPSPRRGPIAASGGPPVRSHLHRISSIFAAGVRV